MEQFFDKIPAAPRLALCAGGGALLYATALRLPALETRREWLEEHRLQVVALGSAALFGLSLLLAPLPQREEELQEPDGSLDGYEPVG